MQMQVAPTQSEIHYHVQEPGAAHKMSSTVAKIVRLDPKLVLGESNLFKYDPTDERIVLSSPFQNLLKTLVELNELDNRVLAAKTLNDLNAILQQPQAEGGGLLRKAGTERWHLEDNPTKIKYRQTFEQLLQQLGFYFPKSIDLQMSIDHCIIFGATAQRMENRIIETVNYLKSKLTVTGHVFLLGSNRKLTPEEVHYLKSKIEQLEESKRDYWNHVFHDPEQSTEANAFVFLWECTVPHEVQVKLQDKLIGINSTRIGSSYKETSGHRVTTEVTTADWQAYFKENEPQAIFAIAEQPYIRLLDQLRVSVLTKGKRASREELTDRISRAIFYFASPSPNSYPLMSVVFDEIARNVYRVTDTLKYLESLK